MGVEAALAIAFPAYASAVLQVGIDKLLDVLANHYSADKFGSKSEVEKELRKLERVMTNISHLLHEFNGVSDRGMQLRLRELRDIAFRADNFVDELHIMFKIESDVEKHKNKIEELYSKFREFAERRDQTLKDKISKFTNRSDKVLKEQMNFIETIQKDRTMRRSDCTIAQSSTYQLDPRVFGREDDKRRLLEAIGSHSDTHHLSIIPIIGMTGIGKTTLARYAFNDPIVDDLFQIKAWISLGVEFDLKRLTQMMLESITGEVCSILSLNELQDILHKSLEGKRFLIVLDGAWNEKKDNWDKLLGPLQTTIPGSVVLLTTQSPTIASTVGTTETLQLDNLSGDDCGAIFWKHACREEQACRDQELHNIGKKIILKCYGIPVVAKTLGELLWMKKDKNEWEFILETDIWRLHGFENEILDGLRLSYSKLPMYLQPCITYCAIFPKDHVFEKDIIIQLWMAEELLKPNERVRMEDAGALYFDELVDRSFFERVSSTGESPGYVMNWLMYDMVQLVAGDSSFRGVVDQGSPPHNESLVRHLLIMCINVGEGLERFKDFKNLRSLMLLLRQDSMVKEIPNVFLESMQSIRVLDLKGSSITALPGSIEKLKLLRYLNLSSTQIVEICNELCDLFMLQTLKMRNCEKLCLLPMAFGNLYNLRTLEMDENRVGLPPKIGNLTMLQELKKFDVRKEDGHKLCELQNLLELREALCILKLENVSNVDEARDARMGNKEHLSRLQLEWGQRQHQCENEDMILKRLQPHHNLKELKIKGYLVDRLPDWKWKLPSNLVEVELVGCANLRSIEQLNCLQSLKILRLWGNSVVEEIDESFFGLLVDNAETTFSSLEILHLHSWTVLRRWIKVHDNAFKLLNNVVIHSCQRLDTLPDFNSFCSLRSLEFEECPELMLSQGGRPKTLQRLVYKGCSRLGVDSVPNDSAVWPFVWWLPNTES